MINFSQQFQTEEWDVNAVWLDITLEDGTVLNYDESRISTGGFTRDTSTSVNNEFTVGAAVTGKLSLILVNDDDELSGYDFRGATVVAWVGGKNLPVLMDELHPDADVAGTQFTITGLTFEQLICFTVGVGLDFGSSGGEHDIAQTYITAVSMSGDVTTITVHDAVTITPETYISVTTTEKVNYGRYHVDEYTYDGANINLVAYDDMCLFDVRCVDTSISWSSGKTIADLVDNCRQVAQIGLWNSTLPGPSGYTIAQKPEQWDTMTLHDVISYCAQIMGCFAHIVYDTSVSPATYKLKFDWYDVSNMGIDQYDGGTFDTTTTPYSDGAELDGGDFSYIDTESTLVPNVPSTLSTYTGTSGAYYYLSDRVIPAGSTITSIKIGTKVSNDGTIIFVNDDDIVVQKYTVSCVADEWNTFNINLVASENLRLAVNAKTAYTTSNVADDAALATDGLWYSSQVDAEVGTTMTFTHGSQYKFLFAIQWEIETGIGTINGGAFGDRSNIHIISSPFDLTVDTDDVLITGVTVTLDPSDNIEAGDDTEVYTTELPVGESDEYIININGNPLIETVAQANAVRDYISSVIVGMRFRPLSASLVENPSMEAGDVAIITGKNQNTYTCFLSHVVYTVASTTSISCDASSTMQNLKSRYSNTQKTYALINRKFEKAISDAESAMTGILGALATTMGLYDISETQADGSVIYMFGDAQTKAASTKIWRFSAGALTVSNDGGVTWNAALSADGILVLQELYAIKVNAENIVTGLLTLGGTNNTNGNMRVLNSNGVQIGKWDKDGIEAINMTAYGSLICYENYTVS